MFFPFCYSEFHVRDAINIEHIAKKYNTSETFFYPKLVFLYLFSAPPPLTNRQNGTILYHVS